MKFISLDSDRSKEGREKTKKMKLQVIISTFERNKCLKKITQVRPGKKLYFFLKLPLTLGGVEGHKFEKNIHNGLTLNGFKLKTVFFYLFKLKYFLLQI